MHSLLEKSWCAHTFRCSDHSRARFPSRGYNPVGHTDLPIPGCFKQRGSQTSTLSLVSRFRLSMMGALISMRTSSETRFQTQRVEGGIEFDSHLVGGV
jgi:hypothetical protein